MQKVEQAFLSVSDSATYAASEFDYFIKIWKASAANDD